MLYLMFHVQKKTGAGHHALQCVLTPVQEKQDAAERQLEELSKKVSQLELKRQQLQGALGDASCDSKVQCRTLFPASRAGVELTFHWKKKPAKMQHLQIVPPLPCLCFTMFVAFAASQCTAGSL